MKGQLLTFYNNFRMSQALKKKKETKMTKQTQEELPISSQEIEEKYVHLQTILMVTQLNCAYYEMGLSLQKVNSRLENNYRATKLMAFLKIYHYRPDTLDLQAKKDQFAVLQKKRQKQQLEGQLRLSLLDEDFSPFKVRKTLPMKRNSVEVMCQLAAKCEQKLSRVVRLVKVKLCNHLSYSFNRLKAYQSISVQIISEKSSKIQTNDSQKSKIFKRSVERKSNRKSFSLEKSAALSKKDNYVQVKFQNYKQGSVQIKPKVEELQLLSVASHNSSLNRFFQDRGDTGGSRERRNIFMPVRDKNLSKCSSSKKLMSMSMLSSEKQQKIKQLQYLKGKYKKLMDEFAWFSDRFLKVIEEQDYVQ